MGLYQELLKKKIIIQTDDDRIVVNNALPDKTKPLSSGTNNQNSQRASVAQVSQEILNPSNSNTWFKGSNAFKDNKGNWFTDTLSSGISTIGDVGINLIKGIANIGEGIGDLGSYGIAQYHESIGNLSRANQIRERAKINAVDKLFSTVEEKVDENSILGDKTDNIVQGLGYVAGMAAISVFSGGTATGLGAGATAATASATAATTGTTFISAMGQGMTQAYEEGSDNDNAWKYGIVSGLAEAGSELLFGGLGKAGKAIGYSKSAIPIDDAIAKKVSSIFKSTIGKNLAEYTIKAGAEGTEEVVSGFIQALGQKMTYKSQEELGKIIKNQNLLEEFVAGAITSAIAQAPGQNGIINKTRRGESFLDIGKNDQQETTQNEYIEPIQQTPQQAQQNVQNTSDLMQTAVQYNKDTNDTSLKLVDDMLNRRGITGRFDGTLFDNENQNAIWRVVGINEDGTPQREVIFNPNSTSDRAFVEVAVHEMSHDLEGDTAYHKNLVNNLIKYAQNKEGYAEARKTLEETYSKVYDSNSRVFQQLIDEEFAADMLAKNLGNQEFINQLVNQDRSTMQKVWDWIKQKINSLTGNTNEAVYWQDIANKFEKAYNQKYQGTNENTTKYFIETVEKYDEMKYNNAEEIMLPKKEYGILAHIINSDSNIKPGVNYVETTNARYTVYYKKTGEFKVITRKVDKNAGELIERINSTGGERGNSEAHSGFSGNETTAGSNDEISNINTQGNSKRNRSATSSTKNIRNSIENSEKGSFSMQELKEKQLEVIQKSNPMTDNYHTGIRSIEDIKTLEETIQDEEWSEYDEYNPDLTKEEIEKAIKEGKITVYSSYPIEQGVFVSPSRMEAESYSGNGKVYSKEVDLKDVAWIDPTQGQYAKINEEGKKSISNKTFEQWLKDNIPSKGTKGKTIQELNIAPIAKSQEMVYNSNNEGGVSDEFRKLQEEGRRLSKRDIQALYDGDKSGIKGKRKAIRKVLQKELQSFFNGDNDRVRIVNNSKTNTEIKIAKVDAKAFYDSFSLNHLYMKNKDTVDLHELKDYKKGTAYLTEDGMRGFYITEKGDLQSVFNNSGEVGFLETIADIVKEEANTLDCFQNKQQSLADLYEDEFGFKTASIMDFNKEILIKEKGKEYADYFVNRYGEASVHFMVNTDKEIETRHFNKDQYNEAIEYRNKFIKNSNKGSFSVEEKPIAPIKSDIQKKNNNMAQLLEKTKASDTLPIPIKENNELKLPIPIKENKQKAKKKREALIGKGVKRVEIEQISKNEKNKLTNKQKYDKYKENIIKAKETETNNLIRYKNTTTKNIDKKIAEIQSEIDSKKNKNTQLVAIKKRQIEDLKKKRAKIENIYNSRIDKVNNSVTKEKIELKTRNMMKQDARDIIREELTPLVEDLTKYKDKKNGLLFNREIAQRNIEDVVKDKELANAINDTIFNPIQKHQAEKTRDIKRYFEKIKALDLDTKQKYKYTPKGETKTYKIDEATLAQLVIENKINDTDLRNYNLDEKQIDKIHSAVNVFNEILNNLYDQMNEIQVQYGYAPIGHIKNYFPHFLENGADSVLGKISSYFGIDVSNQSLPTDIAGRTDTFKPGETWNANLQKRRTKKTDYDALTALDRYIRGAEEIIHTTEDIQKLREYSRAIRYQYSDEGIQKDIEKIERNNELTQEAKDAALEGIYEKVKNKGLPNFVTWLDDYTNTLANKKSFSDRNMEHQIGRNLYTSMSSIESRIAANTIGGNLSVSLTNFAPIFQAMGTTNPGYIMSAIGKVTINDVKGFIGNKDTSFVDNSTFLTNRQGVDSIGRLKATQKFGNTMSTPMQSVDMFTAETIVRAKYMENLDKGMTEEVALEEADKYASRLMGDRSKGALPIVFNTKNPISKLLTMFQVEPNNIVSNYLKDMPREAKNKKQLTWQATKLMVASYAFNTIAMAIRGGNEILPDPIRFVSYIIKMITGDDDEKEKARDDLGELVFGTIPFLSNVAGMVGMEDIGRVPISNAMPNLGNVFSWFDKEVDSNNKKETIVKELLRPMYYLGLPAGGAQIKKTLEAIYTMAKGGSYKTNKKGETNLQFPIENLNVGQAIKAGLFGKYAFPLAKDYADRGYKALNKKQTNIYKEAQIPYKQLLDYVDADLKKDEDKINYISSKDMTTQQKWGIYKYDIFSTVEREDGTTELSDAEYITSNGVSKEEYIELYNKAKQNEVDMITEEKYKELKDNDININNYLDYTIKTKDILKQKQARGELSGDQQLKDKDRIQILLDSNYSNSQKSAIYKTYIGTNDDIYNSILGKDNISISEYLKYKQQEFSSDKKDDGTLEGVSVSGSKKQKVLDYVNKMKINYNQRLVLLGSQYSLEDEERRDLATYLNKFAKNQDERVEIYEKFSKNFTILKDKTIIYKKRGR